MSTQPKTVNLQELASQLEQTGKSIEAKVKDSDRRLDITTDMLLKKIPELKNFEKTTTIYQARWDGEALRIEVPRVCRSVESGEVIVQLPNLEQLLNVEYVSYVCGLGGYAVIKVGTSNFQIGLTANLEIDDLENSEGNGKPPSEVLGYEKRPEIPLRSDSIPLNEEIIVIGNGKKSREYGTALCDIKITSTGEIIRNVLCNTQLERLIKKYGSDGNCKFKVTKKSPNTKDSKKTTVSILDLNGVDFSDLEV